MQFVLNFRLRVPIEISEEDYARGEEIARDVFELKPSQIIDGCAAVTQLIVNDETTVGDEVNAAVHEAAENWLDADWDVTRGVTAWPRMTGGD